MVGHGDRRRIPNVFGSAETRGINVAVVWEDANVEHAAKECAKSFIGRQGQKCSSVRVVMVHAGVKEAFKANLEKEVAVVKYGNVLEGADVGPVITREAGERIVETVRELFRAGVIEERTPSRSGTGFTMSVEKTSLGILQSAPSKFDPLITPTVLYATSHVSKDEVPAHRLMNTEIFGPVTTVVSVSSLSDVKRLCELSDFALTGTFFTQSLDVSMALRRIIPAGNLYANRKCTGALVETECFGGLRSASSPTGIKGKQSLALFGSMQTHSGFYPAVWNKKKRAKDIERMEDELGFVFSKK